MSVNATVMSVAVDNFCNLFPKGKLTTPLADTVKFNYFVEFFGQYKPSVAILASFLHFVWSRISETRCKRSNAVDMFLKKDNCPRFPACYDIHVGY